MNRSINISQTITRAPSRLCLLCLIGLTVFAAPVAAQVFNNGPSDPALFDTVINVPTDPDIGNFEDFGGDGSTTQLNISDGGSIGRNLDALTGSEVNISGGIVGGNFDASSGSEINISGGDVGRSFRVFDRSVANITGGSVGPSFSARSGSEVNISGGNFGLSFGALSGSAVNISGGSFRRQFNALSGSNVQLIGGEFQFNGSAFSGGSISLNEGDVFTGTLADGSAFVFSDGLRDNRIFPASPRVGDSLTGVNLTSAVLPAADLSPIVVSTANPNLPSGLRAGQTLTLVVGGVLGDDFEAVNATLNVEGGSLGDFAGVVNSEVNISGGTVGEQFNANLGSAVNITGGIIGPSFNTFSGSVVNISGGSIGIGFEAEPGSAVNISGGSFGHSFETESGSDVALVGGEFKLNGAAFSGASISLAEGDVFTGTLADGSAFIFSDGADALIFLQGPNDVLSGVQLTPFVLPTFDLLPIVVSTANPNRPSGLRAGQRLTLIDDGVLKDDFEAVDATLNVEGGSLGDFAGAVNSTVNISGGIVGAQFNASLDSEVNISGGIVGPFFNALSGSVVNISGGSLGEDSAAFNGSEVNIRGGTVGDGFYAFFGSAVNLLGSDFAVDGVPLDSLTIDDPFTIIDRGVTLSGLLADGSAFSFDLNRNTAPFGFREDFFHPDATLTVTLVSPEPNLLLCDVNLDGELNFLDVAPFIAILTSNTYSPEADCNQDGEVNFLDIAPLIALLSGN